MAEQKIARIRKVAMRDFYERFVETRTPVIIEGIFDGMELERFADYFGDLEVNAQREYMSAYMLNDNGLQETTIRGILDTYEQNPESDMLVTEQPTHPELRKAFPQSEHSDIGPADDLKSQLFIANRGNRANLHFDSDQREVLFHQIVGNKRCFLFPIESSYKLAPILHYSRLLLDKFSESEKKELVDYANGWDFTVVPGDVLYMPALIWHHFDYEDTAISINYRAGRHRFRRFLGDHLQADVHLQQFGAKLTSEEVTRTQFSREISAIREAYASQTSPADRVLAAMKVIADFTPEAALSRHIMTPEEFWDWELSQTREIVMSPHGKAGRGAPDAHLELLVL